MIVVLDSNVLVQLFGRASPLAPLKSALLDGRLELAVSTAILLEYEEVICRHADRARWEDVARALELSALLHGNVRMVEPSFRFHTIPADADDDAFADCAITASADFIITADRHFDALAGTGYKPQPIAPEKFIERHLTSGA